MEPKPPIQEFLAHYASPYYDPVKAHEYYMRTRELKGGRIVSARAAPKRSSAKLSDEGKRVWAYTKEQIKEEKKDKVEAEREKRNQTTQQLRAQAKATRERINARLKMFSKRNGKSGAGQASAQRERVAAELKAAVSAAREAYQTAKTQLDSSYEEIYQREFDRIASEMPKVSKRRSTPKTKK